MTDAGGRPDGPPEGSDDARAAEQLRALPRTVAMPRDVSIRIAAAIEAESQAAHARGTLQAPADGASADGSGLVSSPADAPRGWFRRRFGQILVGAAGVSVIALGVYVASPGGSDVTASDSANGSAQESAEGPDGSGDTEETLSPMVEAPGQDAESESDDESMMGQQDSALTELVRSVATTGTEVERDCGAVFASTIDATLLGSEDIDDGVLVVTTVEGTSTVEGWTLDSCDTSASPGDADPVVVPRP